MQSLDGPLGSPSPPPALAEMVEDLVVCAAVLAQVCDDFLRAQSAADSLSPSASLRLASMARWLAVVDA